MPVLIAIRYYKLEGNSQGIAAGLLATSGKRSVSARPLATDSATSLGVRLERANEVAVIKFY